MTASDVPAGMRLKEAAGWNQTEADWLRFLWLNPEGCFVAEMGGRVCGTVTTIVYAMRAQAAGMLAWIGMVLVDPRDRGQGIGTTLLQHAIAYLDARQVTTIKLDATPAGEPIYRKLGFTAEYRLERWQRRGTAKQKVERPATEDRGISELLDWDGEIFGAERRALLQSLHRDAPEFTMTSTSSGELAGYALGRHGSRADHLGPWVAEDESIAQELLENFLERTASPVIFVDVSLPSAWARRLVEARGFEFTRPLLRMVRGPNPSPGEPEFVGAVLGPEFG